MKHRIIRPEDDLHNLSQTNVCDTFTKIILLFHFDLIFPGIHIDVVYFKYLHITIISNYIPIICQNKRYLNIV